MLKNSYKEAIKSYIVKTVLKDRQHYYFQNQYFEQELSRLYEKIDKMEELRGKDRTELESCLEQMEALQSDIYAREFEVFKA